MQVFNSCTFYIFTVSEFLSDGCTTIQERKIIYISWSTYSFFDIKYKNKNFRGNKPPRRFIIYSELYKVFFFGTRYWLERSDGATYAGVWVMYKLKVWNFILEQTAFAKHILHDTLYMRLAIDWVHTSLQGCRLFEFGAKVFSSDHSDGNQRNESV